VLGSIRTDVGASHIQISLQVRAGHAPKGNVLLCSSPYNPFVDYRFLDNLKVFLRELQVQVNGCFELPSTLNAFRVVVLMNEGLRYCLQDRATVLHDYLAQGGRLLVLGDHYGRHHAMQANHFTEHYGAVLEHTEYDEIVCHSRHLMKSHFAMHGVEYLRWVFTSPIKCFDQGKVLVQDPKNETDGFVVCAGPRENLYVLGASLLQSSVCAGWPFDNARLLANLLVGE
jgi:hypothetical protein